jgi:hypothetical protein
MATSAAHDQLASQARRLYTEQLVKGLTHVVQVVLDGARNLFDKPSEHNTWARRRDLFQGLNAGAQGWHRGIVTGLRQALLHGVSASKVGDWPAAGGAGRDQFSLVSDDTIDVEIVTSRLALAMMDRASWEFSDLRSRIAHLEGRAELDAHDLLRAHVLARIAFEAWRAVGLTLDGWREVQELLHDEFAHLLEESYHETNRWLVSQNVLPDVDLRPFIRRAMTHPNAPLGWQSGTGAGGGGFGHSGYGGVHGHSGSGGIGGYGPGAVGAAGALGGSAGAGGLAGTAGPGGVGGVPGGVGSHGAQAGHGTHAGHGAGGAGAPGRGTGGLSLEPRDAPSGAPPRGVGEETRLMTRTTPLARGRETAEAVIGRLNKLIGRHVPGFAQTASRAIGVVAPTAPAPAVSPGLSRAIAQVEQGVRQYFRDAPGAQGGGGEAVATAPVVLDELQQRKQALKKAAATPEERATIEIVALLFQSILTEERIPATVRVWFARLQMPVLRVAVSEPDFFATIDHPARRLIDRMGACVMGFEVGGTVGDSLEREIKRIVQVVEAYPDTGRRVFSTVLVEFEKFLEHYFRSENEMTKRGVSLAQQVEQRETMAIQYTIELRRMLNEVPVQEGVRQFLFHVWADVLATTAVRWGTGSEQTKGMKKAAADLIWSASAKVTREERAEVLRKLPLLLKALREGMAAAGMEAAKQDEHIQQVNNSLAAAFTAKAAVIPDDRLRELMERLESLEELLPEEAEHIDIDESMVLDLSGYQNSELEVVLEGGSTPTPAMLAWARELQVGSWYMLERGGRQEPVQLSWHGLRKQLSLFVTPQGRCVLFQQHRLASYLQAGLLLPAQDEALTVRATRTALARLDVNAQQLLN